MEKCLKKEITKKELLNISQILALLFFIGGITGFIYEELFYKIDLGYWVKRGTTFGPWIPIYGFGSIFIFIFTYYIKKNPLLVFTVSCIVTGTLEFLTGYILDVFFNIRLWDYNVEILNFGNINGYICFRSVVLFGFAGLLLVYVIYPMIKKLKNKCNKILYNVLCFVPAIIFLIDIIISDIL